jgi:AAA+ superfamily predicted ATPase
MPLLAKRASDLLSKWVGESEQNIAQAFRQAENENAVHLIDEVDGLLRDRRSAQHSFEVTQVNEMLTGMESFPGLFIASTNLREGLDAASLRRFDLKVRFDYLRPDQAWKLFCRYCEALHLPTPNSVIEYRLARLSMLAPGDFAMAMRQTRFRNVTAAEHLLEILEAECALKEGSKNAIGFV